MEGAGAGAAACGVSWGKKHRMELLAGGKGKLQNNGNCIPLPSCCLFLTPPAWQLGAKSTSLCPGGVRKPCSMKKGPFVQ